MAKATITITDVDGDPNSVDVIGLIEPTPESTEHLTLAQQMGVTLIALIVQEQNKEDAGIFSEDLL